MKNHKNPLLSFIINITRVITTPMYLVVVVVLIALFPSRTLKISAPIIGTSNVKYTNKSCYVSTEDIMLRTRRILKLNLNPEANIWIDKIEYLEQLEHLDFLEGYDYTLSTANPREELDYQRMEEWYLEQEIKSIREQQTKEQEQVQREIEVLSRYIPTLCYVSLEYWPYDSF